MNSKPHIYLLAALFFLIKSVGLQGQVISVEQNYAANSPAIAMVQTVFSATVYVNKVEMNQRRFQVLVDSVKRLDTSGTMLTAEEKLDIVVKALYNNPLRFFSPTNRYFRQRHRILSSGTGFFVTGDGYIVTNAHILDRDSAYIRRKFILSTFQEVTESNITSLQASWAMTLTDEQRNLLNDAYSLIYSQLSSMILFDLKREIYVQYRIEKENGQSAVGRMAARVVKKGKPMPGKDVAILKVDSVQQMPTIPISSDSIPWIGEQVLVLGYPEPVTSNTFLAKETTLEPTLTAGVISAIKKSIGGWPVIQMDAVISHGSSGSPVCNNKGKVIGLATFGTLEQSTGTLASSYNFAITIPVVRQFLDSAGVKAQTSEASEAWHQAIDLCDKGYFVKALRKFNTVKELNENYPSLSYYTTFVKKKISAGEDKSVSIQKFVFRIIAFILIVILIVYIFIRQRKNNLKF